ncbi:hypothetical protein D9611_002254 [Ephemerocybe angulata]|uniref:Single-strand binding protein family-domain-containing protein n=2 Tax=Ephemerocybe angulata TaxID=980116 RepID=A0A8H6IEI0_9AGAR|nr:hypothetical protein D9611_002254 [Tulosesus angulatus]KAF6762803.1 single-strand binding protein family-domain-containing protein [Tulosesus angulatus]
MFSALRTSSLRASSLRTFSTSATRRGDISKLTLVGTLVREPEVRTTKSEKEFILYTIATNNPAGPPGPDGERAPTSATFHRVLSFQEHANKWLRNVKKGSRVYVETTFEVREPEEGADPSTPRGQRQIFLKQDTFRVVAPPRVRESRESEEHEPEGHERF